VIAVIEQPLFFHRQRVDRVEFEHGNTTSPQAIEEGRRRTEGANAVIDHVYLYAPPLLRQQQIGKLPADFIIFDDVGLQIDMVPGFADGSKHRRIGRRAVLQQRDLVADNQRTADDGLFQRNLLVENIDVTGFPLELGDNRGVFPGRERAADIFEAGSLCGVTGDDGFAVGQRRTAHAVNQKIRG